MIDDKCKIHNYVITAKDDRTAIELIKPFKPPGCALIVTSEKHPYLYRLVWSKRALRPRVRFDLEELENINITTYGELCSSVANSD